MEETSHPEERPDIKTRWTKGQSGNPNGRRLRGAGATLTGLARTMMERPVDGADGERHTRLAEYMIDVVRRADAGDLKSRMFLLQAIDRGDRRKLTAQRNARKAKSEDLRKFEEEKAAEISDPMPPLEPEVEDAQVVKDMRPTAPPRKPAATPASAFAKAPADEPRSPAEPWRSRAAHTPPAPPPRNPQPEDASTYRRDAHGHLVTPEGRVLSPEEEERLANPYWPHVSPHLKKAPSAGDFAGDSAGRESPAPASQVVASTEDFVREKISQQTPPSARGAEAVATARPTGPSCEDRLVNASRPHVSAHEKKDERAGIYAGLNEGESAGFKSPAAETQALESARDFGSEKFSQKTPLPDTVQTGAIVRR